MRTQPALKPTPQDPGGDTMIQTNRGPDQGPSSTTRRRSPTDRQTWQNHWNHSQRATVHNIWGLKAGEPFGSVWSDRQQAPPKGQSIVSSFPVAHTEVQDAKGEAGGMKVQSIVQPLNISAGVANATVTNATVINVATDDTTVSAEVHN